MKTTICTMTVITLSSFQQHGVEVLEISTYVDGTACSDRSHVYLSIHHMTYVCVYICTVCVYIYIYTILQIYIYIYIYIYHRET